MNETPAIQLRDVHLRFGRKAVLSGVDLRVEAGTTLALLGRNGTGKSTLLRLCLGILRANGGSLEVLGEDPARRRRDWQRKLAYVPDQPDCPAWMTLRDLLEMQRVHFGSVDTKLAADCAQRLEVPERTAVRRMSRGQSMKTMLVAALAVRPELLLLDEPFAGLDVLVREEVMRGVLEALEEPRPTIVLVTHELDAIARLADRVAVLHDGRIVSERSVDEIAVESTSGPEGLQEELRRWTLGARQGAELQEVGR